MISLETQRYNKLNALAETDGIVIFGCKEDKNIPTGELCRAFSVDTNVYNRSFDELSVKDAVEVYEQTVAPLNPETLLIHLGEADIEFFTQNPGEFDNKYRELINTVRKHNKKCRISVISLRNYKNDRNITEMNRHLKYLADSEKCEYGDIASKRVWNPKAEMEAVSFVYSIGFVNPIKNKRPLYDLVKILFCYEA
ncbi:MAG: hypothetical protein UHM16_03925 [Acutalibacteraceae bacterium]|jgi:hypothetical protein|nr:hypothetical protein [Acutalibacteraceae bacterium]